MLQHLVQGMFLQMANVSTSPPLTNGTTNNYGGVTGLTVVRAGSTFPEVNSSGSQIAVGTYSNVVSGLPGDGIDVTITSTAVTNTVQTATNWSAAFSLAANTGPALAGAPSMTQSGSNIGLTGSGNTAGTGIYGCISACLTQMGATNVSVGSNAFTTFRTTAIYTSNPGTTLTFQVPIFIQNFGVDLYGSTATVQYVSAVNTTTTITSSTAIATNKTGETITINGVQYADNTEIGTVGSNSSGNTTSWTLPAVTTLTTYTFTNNTGNSVTIEDTEISNGNSATVALLGTQFNITYTGAEVESDPVPVYVPGTKPNYAALLPQIAAETDATRKLAWIEACYQFPIPLTEGEEDLFNYVFKDYIDDNPGLDNQGNYVSLVGVYYDDLGRKTSDVVGGPYFIYGTGKTGFGTGLKGYFYPVYTKESAISGSQHIHTFNEYSQTFYMPDGEMNHAVQTKPTQYARFLTGDSVVDNAPVQQEQQQQQDDSGDSGSTTTEQTAVIALPSEDGTTYNYGGITGLTITRATTTSSSSSQLGPFTTGSIDKNYSINVGTSSDNNHLANDLFNMTNSNTSSNVKVTVTGSSGSRDFTIQNSSTALPIGSGPYNVLNSSGDNVAVRYRYYYTRTTSTSATTYSFTNNTGYSATIEGITLANGAGPTEITITGDINITYITGS